MSPEKYNLNLKDNSNDKNIEISEDFVEFVKNIIEKLKSVGSKIKSNELYTYGTFKEKSGSGRVFDVESISWENDPFGNKDRNEQSILLIGIDSETNKIAGIRRSSVRKSANYKNAYDEEGLIENCIKGIGAASALENTLAKILQKISDDKKLPIIQYAINANLIGLEDFKNENANNLNNEKYQNELKQKEDEQKRWQKLYGEGGNLGFKPFEESKDMYKKAFLPKENADSTSNTITEEKYNEILKKVEELIK